MMKRTVEHVPYLLAMSAAAVVSVAGCAAFGPAGNDSMCSRDTSALSYSPQQIVAHACARLLSDQPVAPGTEIWIVEPKIYGLDEKTAIIYGNYYLTEAEYRHIPQIYPLVFRTGDRGRTWLQVLDPVTTRASDLVELRFLDAERGWIEWEHDIEGPAFGMLLTRGGGYTWEESTFHGITNLSSLRAWSFTSRWTGECIVDPQVELPINGDMNREIDCWRMNTDDGGRNWYVTKTIAVDDPARVAASALPECVWMEKSPRWSVKETTDSFSVQILDEGDEWETVLSLPRVAYRSTREIAN